MCKQDHDKFEIEQKEGPKGGLDAPGNNSGKVGGSDKCHIYNLENSHG
jgi:hypothetical protein